MVPYVEKILSEMRVATLEAFQRCYRHFMHQDDHCQKALCVVGVTYCTAYNAKIFLKFSMGLFIGSLLVQN